ncbi:MmpS family transport accessory protein [Segniliparus rugosus]|nr:MmpS family transport accessory protein [Segniliparus rugosus]
MKTAKLPLLFVMAVVGVLVVGGFALVAVVSLPARDGGAALDRVEQATSAPTGSSIAASTPQRMPSPDSPRATTSTTGAFPEPSTRRSSAASTPTAKGIPMTVSYSVTGPAVASILMYWQADHDIASEHGIALPWSRTVTLTDQNPIRLSAQVDSGTAHCRITVDGQVVAEATGDYFVSCETTLRPAVHDR